MERILGRHAAQLYAVMRIVVGTAWALHGTQKLFGFPGDKLPTGDPVLIAAGLIELAGGAFIAVGFYTRWAAFISSGLMAVAYLWRHAPDGFWPVVNRGELALIYCFVFLYIAARGPGLWSADGAGESTPE